MRRAILALAFAAAVALGPLPMGVSPALAQTCTFVLGFKTLHDLLPTIVGTCVDDEAHNPANGDALQHTVNGLLVWRKADNFTAFTDGYHSWVNGPYGVEERLNSQRFSWEANPDGLPLANAGTLQRCHTGDLNVSMLSGQGATGHIALTFAVRSMTLQTCTLYGYFGAQLLDANQQPLPTSLNWTPTSFSFHNVPEARVTLATGATAFFAMDYVHIPQPGQTCPPASFLRMTPPDETSSMQVSVQLDPCAGQINESPVVASSADLP